MNYNFCDLINVLKTHDNYDDNSIVKEFTLALSNDPQTALKILFWYRTWYIDSIYVFRLLIKYAYDLIPEIIEVNLWALILFCDELDIISIITNTQMSKSLVRYIRSEYKRGKKFSNKLLSLVGLPKSNFNGKHKYKSKIKCTNDNNQILSAILDDIDLSAIS